MKKGNDGSSHAHIESSAHQMSHYKSLKFKFLAFDLRGLPSADAASTSNCGYKPPRNCRQWDSNPSIISGKVSFLLLFSPSLVMLPKRGRGNKGFSGTNPLCPCMDVSIFSSDFFTGCLERGRRNEQFLGDVEDDAAPLGS